MGEGGASADAGDRLGSRRASRAIFAAVFLSLVAIYSLTAQWSHPYHIDPLTNAITGWYLGNEGTVVADQHLAFIAKGQRGNAAWFVEASDGPVSQYPPGAAVVAGIFYAMFPTDMEVMTVQGSNRPDLPPLEVPMPPLWPATLSAVIVTAAAAAVLALTFYGLSASVPTSIVAGLLLGLATGAWAVAARMSWTHGPAMLALALGALALQRQRWGWAGAAFGLAILCRPHLAIIAAVVGIGLSITRRSASPAIRVGLASTCGLILLLAYNRAVWGVISISGGYGDDFSDRFASSDFSWFLRNVWGALVDRQHGLLTWAPFLLVLGAGAAVARRRLPDWTVLSAVGGLLYLLIQLKANRFSGGDGHFGYRYPLEATVAAAPLLFLGYWHWARERRTARLALEVGLAVALLGQVLGAVGGIVRI